MIRKSEGKKGESCFRPAMSTREVEDHDSDYEIDDQNRISFEEFEEEENKKEIERYHKQLDDTEGFGVDYLPEVIQFGGIRPIDFKKDPSAIPYIMDCVYYALDDHNNKQNEDSGKLKFSRLLKATSSLCGGMKFYITFVGLDEVSQQEKTYETKVYHCCDKSKTVEIFRLAKDQDLSKWADLA